MKYILDNLTVFNSVVKNKKYKCPYCVKTFKDTTQFYFHIATSHKDELPKNVSVKQAVYDKTHPGDHLCQICKINKCVWNESSCRYSTLCKEPFCREEARRRFKNNYKNKNGKEHTIDDPIIQKEMMSRRKSSGIYTFQDKGTLPYISSFEKDFLEFCDIVLNMKSEFLIECPYVFYYTYDGKKHFYLPDYYIPHIDLIIEIKADDDISHPKILAIDKEKEKLKDKSIIDDGNHNYIKITDKKYEQFQEILNILNSNHISQTQSQDKYIIIPERKETIRGFVMPKLDFVSDSKLLTQSILMKKILDSVKGKMELSLVIDKDNVEIKDDPIFNEMDPYICKSYECDFTSDSAISQTFNIFSHYYTKKCEHFINQDYLSIRMDMTRTNDWFTLRVKNIDEKNQRKFIYFLDKFCMDNNISIYSFVETSTGFILFVKDYDKKALIKACDNIHNKYPKSDFIYNEQYIQVPGTVDAGVEVKEIQY